MYLFILTHPEALENDFDAIGVAAYDESEARYFAQQLANQYSDSENPLDDPQIWLNPSYTQIEPVEPETAGPVFASVSKRSAAELIQAHENSLADTN